ncbi:hypothetical protein H671_4g12854 [Cricetulus griseus]|uniref:Uncharacterized protein n=1 Tax=Cricetulus griseus TaxID=10029 RepID=A0A061I6H7_CRIGR|nr:hypothetical protein H671_4g12854 [Cricetulus griseus]
MFEVSCFQCSGAAKRYPRDSIEVSCSMDTLQSQLEFNANCYVPRLLRLSWFSLEKVLSMYLVRRGLTRLPPPASGDSTPIGKFMINASQCDRISLSPILLHPELEKCGPVASES